MSDVEIAIQRVEQAAATMRDAIDALNRVWNRKDVPNTPDEIRAMRRAGERARASCNGAR